MLNDEWLKKKLWEQEVKKWVSKFNLAGNKQEWLKIHQAYLQSDVWAEKRRQALVRANGICESCGAIVINDSLLDVHHLNYDRIGGNENLDDLKVLCYPCHQKADKQRDKRTDERRKNNYYQSRLNGFASKKYGDDWWFEKDEQEVEIEFVTYLYKQSCKENDFDFDPRFDPETDKDFLEFWDSVLEDEN